jgi:cobalt-zinc-cadmium efflux system outer membrane protein
MSLHRWLPAFAVSATLATSAQADPLTYAQALERARTTAPSLQARVLQTDAARASQRAAGALPDPRLTLGVDNLPISGPVAGRFGADEMTMARVGIEQDMPSSAQRRAQRARAAADIDVAKADSAVEGRRVKLATALAWIDLFYAERRLAALNGILSAIEPLWAAAPAGVAAGTTRPAQALAPVRMRAQFQDERDELVASVGRAKAELTRWTGDADPSTAGQAPALEIDPGALKASLDHNPTLAAFRPATDRAEADLALAQAARRPDWSWQASYGRRDPMFGDMISAGVSVRLPLFATQRQDPLIAARRADTARVGAEREDTRRALQAQLDADLADHIMHHQQWLRAQGTLLPAAQDQSDLETASYAAGKAGLADVLEAFGQVADIKLQTLEREAAVARDGVRIVLTYGSDDQ